MVTANVEQNVKGYGSRIEQPELPEVGTPVLFFPRVGEGAGRQDRYPATIKRVDPDGNATIIVFYASDDIREVMVPKRDEQNQRGWEWLKKAAADDEAHLVADLLSRIEALEKANALGPKAAKRASASKRR